LDSAVDLHIVNVLPAAPYRRGTVPATVVPLATRRHPEMPR
jgi:hypothetical protein